MRIRREAVARDIRVAVREPGSAVRYLRSRLAKRLMVDSDPVAAVARLFSSAAVRRIVDVGAHSGEVSARFARIYPGAQLWCIEPSPPAFERLRRRGGGRWTALNVAVADSVGRAKLSANSFSKTNSLLEPAADVGGHYSAPEMEATGYYEVDVVTLDGLAGEHAWETLDILKLDIQGAELMALRGAERMLSEQRIAAIQTEVLFAPFYDGQAYFWDIADHLRGHGYTLLRLCDEIVNRRGWLIQADAIFLSPDRMSAVRL